jgi:hypothetical protein
MQWPIKPFFQLFKLQLIYQKDKVIYLYFDNNRFLDYYLLLLIIIDFFIIIMYYFYYIHLFIVNKIYITFVGEAIVVTLKLIIGESPYADISLIIPGSEYRIVD